MRDYDNDGQMMLFSLEPLGDPSENVPKHNNRSMPLSALVSIPYFHLDLSKDHVDLFGFHYWEFCSPWRESSPPLNTGPAPRKLIKCALSDILEICPQRKYYLSRTACLGILRRAEERGKELPSQLKEALMVQAGLAVRSGGTHSVNGLECPDQSSQKGGFVAVAANQCDEGRDLHDVAETVQVQPGMKQQTFIAENCLNPWDTQQVRVFTPEGETPTLTAGFCAGAAPTAGGIGYQEEVSPTLKASESGTNMVPSILCLNDQGGAVMECSEDISGTLRAQEHGHQPLVLATQQGGAEIGAGVCPTITAAAGMSGNNQPVLFENHGIDARYRGPLPVAPTLPARAGTGGNNLSLVAQAAASVVFSRQRVDRFKDDDVVSTESARQYKDATDLVCQMKIFAQAQYGTYSPSCGTLRAQGGDHGGGSENLVVAEHKPEEYLLIRRLTPLECERLQGFPDGWTDLPGASDSARYRALGNSVAIPCVEFIMRGIACTCQEGRFDIGQHSPSPWQPNQSI